MTARYDAVNIFGKPCRNTGVIAIPIDVSAAATSGLVGSTTVTASWRRLTDALLRTQPRDAILAWQ
ncbi:hypothetical protein ABIA65_006265 [Mycolicibacterium sp. 624]